jgi:glycosyltransferase involved in cell wall biosynthesis
MKKELLFIANNLNCGGAEKALVSLLQTIDYSKYNVDLFVFKHEGVFFGNLPKEVTVLKEQDIVPYLYCSTKTALFKALINLNFSAIYLRLVLFILSKKYTNGVLLEQNFWKYYVKSLSNIKKEYDTAIGFQEKNPIYFCIDKVNAKQKIGWIHTDLEKLQLDFQKDYNYFQELNYIVTVSDGLTERLKNKLPEFSSKIVTIENIVSSKTITELSKESIEFEFDTSFFNLIYVGRLAKEKGLFLGLEALKIVIEKKHKIRLYLIGDGNQKDELISWAEQNNISNNIFFLGLKSNPYSYISRASAFILPSFYEGKSISLEEAKILNKPIVITNFSSAKDQIKNGVTGLIADMNAVSIADKLIQLIENESLALNLNNNLKNTIFGTENEISKFYSLISNG